MSTKTEFTFLSQDGQTQVHASRWVPEGEIKGIFQIVHGMQEYINRYERFAQMLCAQGYVVTGNDHLGHGQTAPTEADLGYFAKKGAENIVYEDVHSLRLLTSAEYPNVPYFILGHSMGSFITRKYLCFHSDGLAGAIIMGTGVMPGIVTGVGIGLCNIIELFRGPRHRSKFVTNIAFGAYNKRIENPRTPSDWLTHDEKIIDDYLKDPFDSFDFTLNGYKFLFRTLAYACKKKHVANVRKDLPIYVVAGDADPVGNYGEGPTKVAQMYRELGIKDVTLKLYPDLRHEILNEIGKEEVDADIVAWLNDHLS